MRRLLSRAQLRRLLAVRLCSQFFDGVFQVALASYALFSQSQPSAATIATALAVTLLPFCVLGPFTGVLLDRWSRRQVLLGANLLRSALVLVVAALVAVDVADPVFYAGVLVCLSVNRFLLAALSAALPHTVRPEELVTANALTPTAGTVAFVAGLGVGGVVRGAAPGALADVVVLLTAAGGYAAAGLLALRLPRGSLGPDLGPDPARDQWGDTVRSVRSGLVDGLRHLRGRPVAAAALVAIGSSRYWLGISSVALVLLHRNFFHRPGEAEAAFADLGTAVLVGGAGFATAALVTPAVVSRIGTHRWLVAMLVLAGAVTLFPGALYTRPAVLVTAYCLGLAAQSVKICVDTVAQIEVEDAYRGRVFALYDVLFNVAFVAAAGTAALVLPLDGRSPALLAVSTVGYLLTAAAYAAVASRG